MNDKDNTTKPELLPCPFCGEEPVLHKSYSRYNVFHRCDAVNSCVSIGRKKDVIDAWNRRA